MSPSGPWATYCPRTSASAFGSEADYTSSTTFSTCRCPLHCLGLATVAYVGSNDRISPQCRSDLDSRAETSRCIIGRSSATTSPSLAFDNANRVSDRPSWVAITVIGKFKDAAIVVSGPLIDHAGYNCGRKLFQFATQIDVTHGVRLPLPRRGPDHGAGRSKGWDAYGNSKGLTVFQIGVNAGIANRVLALRGRLTVPDLSVRPS